MNFNSTDDLTRASNLVRAEPVNPVDLEAPSKSDDELVMCRARIQQLEIDNSDLRRELDALDHKDKLIEALRVELDELRKEREQMRLVKQQVKRVSDTLEIVQEKEVLSK